MRFLTFLQSTTYGLPRNTYMILNGRLQQDEVLWSVRRSLSALALIWTRINTWQRLLPRREPQIAKDTISHYRYAYFFSTAWKRFRVWRLIGSMVNSWASPYLYFWSWVQRALLCITLYCTRCCDAGCMISQCIRIAHKLLHRILCVSYSGVTGVNTTYLYALVTPP